ncbi:Rab38 [Symbiodinium sp. KB8]|nr:Rab38 [Symbiodinium sp. KB8]
MAAESGMTCKVLVLGDAATGKTSMIKQAVSGNFTDLHKPTVGVDFHFKRVHHDGKTVTLQLWDLAGQDRFGHIYRVYYKDAFGAVLVFDLTNPDSFASVANWKREIDSKVTLPNGKPLPVVLAGNKCDLSSASYDKAQLDEYCEANGFVGWFATSAKTNHNITETLSSLVGHMLQHEDAFTEQRKAQEESSKLAVKLSQPKAEETGSCC